MQEQSTIKLKVADINEHLLCSLCGGYLIDATTITECLHPFCRSCIVRYLESHKTCPRCDMLIHKTKPLLNLRPDRTLQTLVYKLVPDVFQNEKRKRRQFYASRPELVPSCGADAGDIEDSYLMYTEDEKISLCLTHCARFPQSMAVLEKPPDKNVDRRYLLCPALVTIACLKKFVQRKFELPKHYQVEIFHSDESLKDACTLMDVANIYCWKRVAPLNLYYVVFDKTQLSLEIASLSEKSLNKHVKSKRKSKPKTSAKPAEGLVKSKSFKPPKNGMRARKSKKAPVGSKACKQPKTCTNPTAASTGSSESSKPDSAVPLRTDAAVCAESPPTGGPSSDNPRVDNNACKDSPPKDSVERARTGSEAGSPGACAELGAFQVVMDTVAEEHAGKEVSRSPPVSDVVASGTQSSHDDTQSAVKIQLKSSGNPPRIKLPKDSKTNNELINNKRVSVDAKRNLKQQPSSGKEHKIIKHGNGISGAPGVNDAAQSIIAAASRDVLPTANSVLTAEAPAAPLDTAHAPVSLETAADGPASTKLKADDSSLTTLRNSTAEDHINLRRDSTTDQRLHTTEKNDENKPTPDGETENKTRKQESNEQTTNNNNSHKNNDTRQKSINSLTNPPDLVKSSWPVVGCLCDKSPVKKCACAEIDNLPDKACEVRCSEAGVNSALIQTLPDSRTSGVVPDKHRSSPASSVCSVTSSHPGASDAAMEDNLSSPGSQTSQTETPPVINHRSRKTPRDKAKSINSIIKQIEERKSKLGDAVSKSQPPPSAVTTPATSASRDDASPVSRKQLPKPSCAKRQHSPNQSSATPMKRLKQMCSTFGDDGEQCTSRRVAGASTSHMYYPPYISPPIIDPRVILQASQLGQIQHNFHQQQAVQHNRHQLKQQYDQQGVRKTLPVERAAHKLPGVVEPRLAAMSPYSRPRADLSRANPSHVPARLSESRHARPMTPLRPAHTGYADHAHNPLANGYDQPLELTTRRSRDRQADEQQSPRIGATFLKIPSLMKP